MLEKFLRSKNIAKFLSLFSRKFYDSKLGIVGKKNREKKYFKT